MANRNTNSNLHTNTTIVVIVNDPATPTGYALEWDDKHIAIDKCDPNHGNPTLHLPENPSNRRFWKVSKIENGDVTLSYKESHPTGPRGMTLPKDWTQYLSAKDKLVYNELYAKAEAAMAKAKAEAAKPLSPLEKAQKELEKAQAKLAKLQAEAKEAK